MPVASYPALAGLAPSIQRKVIYKTIKRESANGKEMRAALWSTPRIQYRLTYNFLRIAGGGGNEANTLVAFVQARLGDWDVFNYTDPLDATVNLCRFDMDGIEIGQLFNNLWEAKTVTFITVKP